MRLCHEERSAFVPFGGLSKLDSEGTSLAFIAREVLSLSRILRCASSSLEVAGERSCHDCHRCECARRAMMAGKAPSPLGLWRSYMYGISNARYPPHHHPVMVPSLPSLPEGSEGEGRPFPKSSEEEGRPFASHGRRGDGHGRYIPTRYTTTARKVPSL